MLAQPMQLKPPPVDKGSTGLEEFREKAKLHEPSLTNRISREFYRKDLQKWQKLYATLASKRPLGSRAAKHFAAISKLCKELLEEYGAEPPPKKRTRAPAAGSPLVYPNFPRDVTHRVHFLEGPGMRRQRAKELSTYATFVSRQESATGRILMSVGTLPTEVRLFERLIEVIESGLFGNPKKYGFEAGRLSKGWTNAPKTALEKIVWDNNMARGYSWRARILGDQFRGIDGKGLPKDLPKLEIVAQWDPDPRFQDILRLTEANQLTDALKLVESIPGYEREALWDEVIYLKALTNGALTADDVRLIAREYATRSSISGRLLDQFDAFLTYLDHSLRADPPTLSELYTFNPDYYQVMKPSPPPLLDWPAYRAHVAQFTVPSLPRGRIFSVNVARAGQGLIENYLNCAEDAFRRDRSIPEMGENSWVSEQALLDLCRSLWPKAVHQWRPWFLGRQSVDIYIREINLAIEYQGQQHYEPIALFGGEEGFRHIQARDERKRRLLRANKVQLLEWRYDLPITRANLDGLLKELGLTLPEKNETCRTS